jgi:2-methylisocitrate lyase-like PEP mutase family enzyme
MSSSSQQELATRFRALHASGADPILVLPNAWDAITARLVEEAGARAIATTSAGIAWALGHADGQQISRELMLGQVRLIVEQVRVPVTADVESGYATGSPEDVAATVRGVLAAGAVGVNLEDAPGRDGATVLDLKQNVERIRAAREAARAAGVDLFINARTDILLRKVGDESGRFDETVRRARAYVAAGADGVFVPGVSDAETIRRLAAAVGAPLNVIGGPGVPTVPELRALGVARVSVGPGLARSVMAHVRRAAAELFEQGTYGALAEQVGSPEANALFAARAVAA